MILSNDGFDAFHYRSYGTFFLHKIGSIISIGDLPTTNIIEPKFLQTLSKYAILMKKEGFYDSKIYQSKRWSGPSVSSNQ